MVGGQEAWDRLPFHTPMDLVRLPDGIPRVDKRALNKGKEVERERMDAFERMKMTGGAEEKTRGKPLDQFAKCKAWMWR